MLLKKGRVLPLQRWLRIFFRSVVNPGRLDFVLLCIRSQHFIDSGIYETQPDAKKTFSANKHFTHNNVIIIFTNSYSQQLWLLQ